MDGEFARFILAAVVIYGGIRFDLMWMRQKLANHDKRISKLEKKENGNTQAQNT